MAARRGVMRWYLIVGTGATLCALLAAVWMAEPAAACGVRCGGPHPTAKPPVKAVPARPFQKPPQAAVVPKPAPKPAPAATSRPAPTRAPAPPPTATRAPAPTPRPAPAAAIPASPPPTVTSTPTPIATVASVSPTSLSTQVNYVVQYYSLNDSRNAPKDMQDVLLANGFHPTKRPELGAVVVFQPSYFKNINGYDFMKDGGMIGVVSSIDAETPTTYRLIVHTAFDAPPVEAVPAPAEEGFTRTYDLPMGPYGKGQVAVFYFVR